MVISTRKEQPLRVRDVADVKVLHKDRGLSIGFDQRDAVVITVFRRLGGNTVNISRDLRALLDRNQLTLAGRSRRQAAAAEHPGRGRLRPVRLRRRRRWTTCATPS